MTTASVILRTLVALAVTTAFYFLLAMQASSIPPAVTRPAVTTAVVAPAVTTAFVAPAVTTALHRIIVSRCLYVAVGSSLVVSLVLTCSFGCHVGRRAGGHRPRRRR